MGILEPSSLLVMAPGQANKICQPNPQQTPRNRCLEKGARGDPQNDAICATDGGDGGSLSKLKVLKVGEGKLESIMKGNCLKLSGVLEEILWGCTLGDTRSPYVVPVGI